MGTNKIDDYLNRIEKSYQPREISLDDYPRSNTYAQSIVEMVDAMRFSLEKFKRYINDENFGSILNTLWARKGLDKEELLSAINNLKLQEQIETDSAGNPIAKLVDVKTLTPKDSEMKKQSDYLKNKLVEFEKLVNKAFVLFNGTWELIKSQGYTITVENPSIKQIFDWTALLPQNGCLELGDNTSAPHWEDLCEKLKSCFDKKEKCCCWAPVVFAGLISLALAAIGILALCNRTELLKLDLCTQAKWLHYVFIIFCVAAIVSAIVLMFYKYLQFQSKQCETEAKLKEKMINNVIEAFHEDREFARQRTKTEISLHEKLEKARIEEWSQNKENQRKLNEMEQERLSDISNAIKELAKTKNTVTIKGPDDKGKTITIERSVLSDDCCDELKGIIEEALKNNNQ